MPILFVIDPPHSLHLKKDSTFALMKEAIKQNHEVYFCLQHDLYIDANQLFCRTHRFEVNIFPNHAKTYETHPVSFFNALFMSCLLYTSPSPRDGLLSRMPSSA